MLRTFCGAALVALALALGGPLSAQPLPTLTGTVTDAAGSPISQANVAVVGSASGTAADADGRYRLSLRPGPYTLRFSAVGFVPAVCEVTVGAQGATLDVRLATAADVLGEVTVSGGRFADPFSATATKGAVSILETPQSLSVVTTPFMDALNVRTVAEALNYTPGVRSQAFGSDTRIDYVQIRGFTSNALFKDGLLLLSNGFSQWTTPPEGIERLDVLRGPASVLYGASNPGGLVNVVSRAPDGQQVRSAEIGADEFGTVYVSGDLGQRFGEVSVRAVGLARAGETQNTARDDRTFGALSVGWTPGDRVSLIGRASAQRDRAQRPTGFLPYQGTVEPLDYGRIPARLFLSDPNIDLYDRDQLELGYSLAWRATDELTIRQNARVARLDLTYAGLFGLFRGNPLPENPRLIGRGNSALENAQDNLTIDTQAALAVTTGAVEHDVLVGLDVASNTLENAQRVGLAPPIDVLAPDYTLPIPALGDAREASQRVGAVGVYAQDAIRLGRVTLSAAGRHDWLRLRSTTASGEQTGSPSRLSGRLGLVYVDPVGIAPYVSTSTFFTPLIGASDATGEFFRPETGAQVEAGVRYQPSAFPLLATAAVFTLTREGVPVRSPTPEFPRNQEQSGEIRSRGAELSLTASPARGLTLTAAATAFQIETLTGDADAIGNRPTATPERLASAFADYRFGSGPLAGLGGGLGVRFTGRSFADTENTLEVPSATVVDAALRYERSPWRLALNVSNVLDEEYVAACPGAGTCYYANVRRATVSLGASF